MPIHNWIWNLTQLLTRIFDIFPIERLNNSKILKILLICTTMQLTGIPAQWHFFATAHGKGPCDGIGGTIKRHAPRASLQLAVDKQITTSYELYAWASAPENLSNIEVKFSSEEDYNQAVNNLNYENNLKQQQAEDKSEDCCISESGNLGIFWDSPAQNTYEKRSAKDIKKSKKWLNEDDAASVLALHSVREAPRLSLRRRAIETEISKSHLQRIFKQNRILPFKQKFRHTLEEGDEAKRLDFCLEMGNRVINDIGFHKQILFSDESTFSTNVVVSSQHCRYWSETNPHFTISHRRQYFKKVNVWCAVSYTNCIIGPYIFKEYLNRDTYLEMLQNFLTDKLDELPLSYRTRLFFQQDGCPAHHAVTVRNWLNSEFNEHWIGRDGPILWPPRSNDLTILDFYLSGRLMQIVYREPLENDEEQLKTRIQNAKQIKLFQYDPVLLKMQRMLTIDILIKIVYRISIQIENRYLLEANLLLASSQHQISLASIRPIKPKKNNAHASRQFTAEKLNKT
ncbi:hypothetical protein NQ318_017723, partial [Aromia moschata]